MKKASKYRNPEKKGRPNPTRRDQIVRALTEGGEMTAREAYEFAREHHGIPSSTNGFGSRFSELHDAGLIDVVGQRICRHSGEKATVWRVHVGATHRRPVPRKLKFFVYLRGDKPSRVSLVQGALRAGETECIQVVEVPNRKTSRLSNTPAELLTSFDAQLQRRKRTVRGPI